ncbi:MAG TPA: hypothetical protein VH796_05060 [Nitrososphaeraceae archaeon]|jgi:hypothetical protein
MDNVSVDDSMIPQISSATVPHSVSSSTAKSSNTEFNTSNRMNLEADKASSIEKIKNHHQTNQ